MPYSNGSLRSYGVVHLVVYPYKTRVPLLVVLSGPSGVGKDAILNSVRLADLPFHFTVTATTRPIRENERDGVDYLFLSKETFEGMVAKEDFLEYAEVYGNWYGVPKSQVKTALASGKDVLLKTDVQGAATIKRLAPQALLVFVAPPSMHELERRLKWRMTESPESLRRRLGTARDELQHLSAFDYVVVNDSLEEAVKQLTAIVLAEKCRVPPRVVHL